MYVIITHQFPASGLDERIYLQSAIDYYNLFKHPTDHIFTQLISFDKDRQPLYSILLSFPLLIFGTFYSYKITLWMNIIFYLITVISIYKLGKVFFHELGGFLAAYTFAFYGFPLFYLHFTYSETAVTMFVVLSLLFLYQSRYLLKLKETILFSLFFLLGSLTRWVTPLFILGPFFVTLFGGIITSLKKKDKMKYFFLHISLFIFIGCILSLIFYYLPNIQYFRAYVSGNNKNAADWATRFLGSPDLRNVFSVRSIMFYFNILSEQTIFFWLLFFLGTLIAIIFWKRYLFLLTAFFIPYFIFTFSTPWKGDRFIVPIYPAMALLSIVPLNHVKIKILRFILIASILIIGFFNFLGASWGVGPMGFQGLKDIVLPAFIHHPRRIYLTPIVWPPRPEETNVDIVANTMKNDWGSRKGRMTFLTAFYIDTLNNGIFTIFGYEQLNIANGLNGPGIAPGDYLTFFQDIRSTDYLLLTTKVYDNNLYSQKMEKAGDFVYFIDTFYKVNLLTKGKLLPVFKPLKTVYIPIDHSLLTVYKKEHSLSNKEWDQIANLFISVDTNSTDNIILAANKMKK